MSRINPGQKKLGQKLQQITTNNRFKIHNNKPKNGAGAEGALFVLLILVFVCYSNFLELLAQLFIWHGFLDMFLRQFVRYLSVSKVVKTVKQMFKPSTNSIKSYIASTKVLTIGFLG